MIESHLCQTLGSSNEQWYVGRKMILKVRPHKLDSDPMRVQMSGLILLAWSQQCRDGSDIKHIPVNNFKQ